jgi:hypothetical protein
MGLHAILG